ncbi:MAG TPA: EI24 domain-containing protein [Bacteroidales bacterium]|nr:EI24 domain-containing protein [Bacteroidales bacterium]HPS18351.1 EI24 domain-containing protein [Bacteroidales bacterium]
MALFKNFSLGFETYIDAHKFIVKNKLWAYVLLPGIINLCLIVLIFFAGLFFSKQITDWFFNFVGITGNEQGVLSYLFSAFYFIMRLLIQVFFFYCYFSIYKYLVLVIMSPVLAILSDKTSKIITGREVPYTFSLLMNDIFRGLAIVLRNIFMELLFIVICFFLSFIPIVGFVIPIFLFFVSMYFYGFSIIYYSHECYRLKISESVKFIRKNKGFAIANGFMFYILLLIPLVGLLVAPSYSVVAATIGVNRILKNQK